jgi:hypothetical protein
MAASPVQVRQHGQHTPIVVLVRLQVELEEDVVDVLADRFLRNMQAAADTGVGPGLGL